MKKFIIISSILAGLAIAGVVAVVGVEVPVKQTRVVKDIPLAQAQQPQNNTTAAPSPAPLPFTQTENNITGTQQ